MNDNEAPNMEIPNLHKAKYLLPIRVRFAWHIVRYYYDYMNAYADDPPYVAAIECIATYLKSSDSSEAIKDNW